MQKKTTVTDDRYYDEKEKNWKMNYIFYNNRVFQIVRDRILFHFEIFKLEKYYLCETDLRSYII